jgi:hypothetical protein
MVFKINSLKPRGHFTLHRDTTRFNIQNFLILPAEYINVLLTHLGTNSVHQHISYYRDEMCLLRSTNSTFKYN